MTAPNPGVADRLAGFARRRRRWLLAGAGVLLAYAVAGFFLAPWLLRNAAIDTVDTRFDAELRLARVAINPFAMSLEINGLEFDGPAGEPLARAGGIFVNFELSSLFRWAWTFSEVRFDAPELFIVRDGSGGINLEALTGTAGGAAEAEAPEPGTTVPRLFVHRFVIHAARVDWKDGVPPEPVETVFGPVSVEIDELSTLPGKAGQKTVVITTETEGTLSWSGTLALNPFSSVGHASLQGSHFALASAYIRHETGLDIVDGTAGIDLDYSVTTGADGQLGAAIENIDLELTGVRVNTFHAEPDDVRQPREFLNLPRIALSGGTVRWPERTISLAELDIDDATLDLLRLASGEFDFARLREAAALPADTAEEDAEPGPRSDWRIDLERLALNDFAFSLVDRSVEPEANVGARDVNLEVRQISNRPGAAFPTTLILSALEGGTVALSGDVTVLPEPVVEFDVAIEALALQGAHPYVQPLADVRLDSGYLDLDGHLRHDAGQPLGVAADLDIVDFLITETDEGTRLGSWARLSVDQLELSLRDNTLDISEVRIEQPYGDIRIAADGSVNLGRVSRQPDGDDEDVPPADEAGERSDSAATAFRATIGRVLIDDGSADFVDESLPLPFSARIKSLDGALTTIATDSEEPSSVDLEGTVDEHGLVRISGVVTPLDFTRNTDMNVAFENVDVPKFSAYSIPFAGRRIASGRLDIDLGYRIIDRQLVGGNRIILRDFELGEKVPHPGALSLPLGLAVGLLKDPSGKIDIDLPVRGDLDNPEFAIGRVIAGALANLIVKIVASPFALLGNLVGAEADELEYINFLPGRADLTPPEIERVGKLTEALTLRPVLRLEISGVIDREADSLALRTTSVDARIEARLQADASDGGDEDGFAERRIAAIEAMYRESTGAEAGELQVLGEQFTSTDIDAETGTETRRFDGLAYSAELRRRLIEAEPVTEDALVALARERASNTRTAVIEAEPSLDSRVTVVDLREEESGGDEDVVRMKVSLSVGAADGNPP